jgi:hypothetical protein
MQLRRARCGLKSDRSERQELLRELSKRDPADADGSISGTRTGSCKSYDGTHEHDVLQVAGTRQGLAVALTVERPAAKRRDEPDIEEPPQPAGAPTARAAERRGGDEHHLT